MGWRRALLLLVVLALTAADCGGSISYKPPGVPIIISVDDDGNVTLSIEHSVVTPIGEFSFGADIEIEEDDSWLVTVQKDGGPIHAYEIRVDEDTLEVIAGSNDGFRVAIGNTRVEIAVTGAETLLIVSQGDAPSIDVRPEPAPDPDAIGCPNVGESYQVMLLDAGPLRVRLGPGVEYQIDRGLESLTGPLTFSNCDSLDPDDIWWELDEGGWVAARYIEPLGASGDCGNDAPRVQEVYKVVDQLPAGPLNVREGPGTTYSVLDELSEAHGNLRFSGCSRSVHGGAWWLLRDGGYVFAEFIERA